MHAKSEVTIGSGPGAVTFGNRLPLQLLRHEPGEGEDVRIEIYRRLEARPTPDQLQKMVRKLNDVVLGAPRMMVARADIEAEPLIKRSLAAEIAGRVDDMVDGARHGRSLDRWQAIWPHMPYT
jgi:hypothetical protein